MTAGYDGTHADLRPRPTTDSWDDLDDFMSQVDDVDPDRGIDQTMAERMLRRVLRLRRRFAADTEVARDQWEQLNDWITARQDKLDTDTDYLLSCLRQYHEARLEDDPKAKSLRLPSGVLKARKAPDRVEVDVEAFMSSEPAGEMIRTRHEPDKPVILRHVKQTGELPAGVVLVAGEVRFTVEAGDDQ